MNTIETTLVTLEAEAFIPHPKYEDGIVYFDVGIIVTKTPIFYNDFIRPICLPGVNVIRLFLSQIVDQKKLESLSVEQFLS